MKEAMKGNLFYTVKLCEEPEAPFGVAYNILIYQYDGKSTPEYIREYKHIYNNEITGYCKCLEDMGITEILSTAKI